MYVYGEEEIATIAGSFPCSKLHKVLSGRVSSVTISILENGSGLSVVKATRLAGHATPHVQAHTSKLKALQRIFQKCNHICIPEVQFLGEFNLVYKRPLYRATLFERIRYAIYAS